MISKSEMAPVRHRAIVILKMRTCAHGPMEERTTLTGSLAGEAPPVSSQAQVSITQQEPALVCIFRCYCLQIQLLFSKVLRHHVFETRQYCQEE